MGRLFNQYDYGKTCTDPDGIVHGTRSLDGSGTWCGERRIWREERRGIWHNRRWKFDKEPKVITCLRCHARYGKSSLDP